MEQKPETPQDPSMPRDKRLFPDIPQSELPEVLRVDARTLDHLRGQIKAALDEKDPKPLHLNSMQRRFILEYVTFCIEQGRAQIKDWLAATALHLLAQETDSARVQLRATLSSNPHIAANATKIGKMSAIPAAIIMDALPERGVVATTAFGMESQLQSSQKALKIGNYDSAATFAELSISSDTPDVYAHAALCFYMRAAKRGKSIDYGTEQRVEDTNRSMELCRDFNRKAKGRAEYQTMQQHMVKLMQNASALRTKLLEK